MLLTTGVWKRWIKRQTSEALIDMNTKSPLPPTLYMFYRSTPMGVILAKNFMCVLAIICCTIFGAI